MQQGRGCLIAAGLGTAILVTIDVTSDADGAAGGLIPVRYHTLIVVALGVLWIVGAMAVMAERWTTAAVEAGWRAAREEDPTGGAGRPVSKIR